MSTWDKYESACKRHAPALKTFVQNVAACFGVNAQEDTGENYGYGFRVTHDGVTVYLDCQLWDAGAFGDAEPGELGNWHLSACFEGGEIIIGYSPENYTPECWVDYDGPRLGERLATVAAQATEIALRLGEAIEERAGEKESAS